jgi:hypothetical protein
MEVADFSPLPRHAVLTSEDLKYRLHFNVDGSSKLPTQGHEIWLQLSRQTNPKRYKLPAYSKFIHLTFNIVIPILRNNTLWF